MSLLAALRPELLVEALLRLLLTVAVPGFGWPCVDAPPLGADDAAMIDEAYHLCATAGEELWPGWSGIDLPLVLVSGDFEYAVDAPESWTGFVPTSSGDAGILAGRVSVRRRTLQPVLAASFPLDGEPAAILGTPDTMQWSRTQWVLKAAHEFFHVLSMRRGSFAKSASLEIGPADDASWQLDFPFPYDDVDTQALMHIEGRALFVGLSPDADDDVLAESALTILHATAAQRAWLAKRTGNHRAARYKTLQEWFEGLAKYTEHRLARAAAADDYQPRPAFTAIEGHAAYADLWDAVYAEQLEQIRDVGVTPPSRQVFYLLGLGKGLLLDRMNPHWRATVFEPDVWLDDLLAAEAPLAGADGQSQPARAR